MSRLCASTNFHGNFYLLTAIQPKNSAESIKCLLKHSPDQHNISLTTDLCNAIAAGNRGTGGMIQLT